MKGEQIDYCPSADHGKRVGYFERLRVFVVCAAHRQHPGGPSRIVEPISFAAAIERDPGRRGTYQCDRLNWHAIPHQLAGVVERYPPHERDVFAEDAPLAALRRPPLGAKPMPRCVCVLDIGTVGAGGRRRANCVEH